MVFPPPAAKSLLGGWELFGAVWKAKRCLLEDTEAGQKAAPALLPPSSLQFEEAAGFYFRSLKL